MNRRVILGGALALPLVGVRAVARQADPALAAVKALRVARAALDDAISRADEIAAKMPGHILAQEDQASYDTAFSVLCEAEKAIAATVPTSVAGIRAMMAYVLDYANFAEPETEAILESILESPVLIEGVGA